MHSNQRPQELPIGQDVLLVREDDYFLSLSALAKVSSLSVKTLRAHLSDPVHPIPHYRPKGKVLVRWSEFVRWLEHFRVQVSVDVDRVVREVIDELQMSNSLGTGGRSKRQPHSETRSLEA
jgi:hypothetical protein